MSAVAAKDVAENETEVGMALKENDGKVTVNSLEQFLLRVISVLYM